ncbi:MAG TPA: hypothetical protein PLU17_06615 [Chitinophagaceae bacterium]|nr:hypothetical protein [Chitinophagaceae bacterium]
MGSYSSLAQTNNSVSKADSLRAVNDAIRAANKARIDSMKLANQARRDSLQLVKEMREEKKKELAREKKKKKKGEDLETFTQDNYTSADSLRDAKRDSLKTAREFELEQRKKAIEDKRNIILAGRKKKIEPLTQEMSGGFRLNSDGWSFFVNRGFIDEEEHKKSYLSIDFSEKKHPKETRTQNENFSVVYPNEVKPLPYKYGKVNNFYQFKIGYGAYKELTGKLDKKNVMINWVYNGGLSIGLLKPYYLDLLVPEGNTYVRKFQKYSEANKEYFLDLNNRQTILGGSSFTRGIGETRIMPGLHLKSGFNFDYSASRKSFLGVEIGASAEIYTKAIEIMKNTNNSAFFINFYADIRFGKRWE